MSLILTLSLFLSFNLYAAIDQSIGREIETIKIELDKNEKEIKKVEKGLAYLETELGKGNKKYIQTLKYKAEIEGELSLAKKELLAVELDLKTKQKSAQKSLSALIINSADKRGRPEEIVATRNLIRIMGKYVAELKAQKENNQKMMDSLNLLEGRYVEYLSVEKEMEAMVNDLENQKRQVGGDLTTRIEYRDRLKNSLQAKEKRKEQMVKSFPVNLPKEEVKPVKAIDLSSIALRFYSPLDTHTDIEHKNKGINFKFNHEGPVTATQNGKIVYAGDLSTFGNVVMIDHGDETRSVILGQFKPIVKKGDAISSGETIGHTLPHKGEGRLYFEVRKKQNVVNTMLLMEKEFLVKNKLGQLI